MRTPTDYVELHVHSAYSFLDGASQPQELLARAAELGYTHLALTDHDSLAGAMEFAQAAPLVDVRAIVGTEITVEDDLHTRSHVTLLARTDAGYRNLCRLLTLAYRARGGGRARRRLELAEQPPGRPPNEGTLVLGTPERPHPAVTFEQLLAHTDGLVCLTGCATRGVLVQELANGRHARALDKLRQLRIAFGVQNVYVELQLPLQHGDAARNRALSELAERSRVGTVATGNVHAHTRMRARLHEALVAIRHNVPLEACEPERAGNLALQLCSPQAMAERFRHHPEAVRNTRRIAERIEFDLVGGVGYQYPGMRADADGSATRRLAGICDQILEQRYAGRSTHAEARARLERELHFIEKHGLSGFFLLHRDVLELAREVATDVRGPHSARALNPPGRGRGSSVESILCYLTGLSHVDPLEHDLKLGRFLNEELISVPDIDLDFPRDIRHELLRRLFERYGDRHCAMVAAHSTYRAAGAIRDLGKALGLPSGELRQLAHRCDSYSARGVAEFVEGTGPRWRALGVLAGEIAGLPRQIGLHSGGVVIATEPLSDVVPLQPAATPGRQLCQWDKDSCADAGFLKIDVLGLGMLSAVEECVETVSLQDGAPLDLSRIDYAGPAIFEQIQAGDTVGTFQIESRAQIASIQRVKPQNLHDLTVQVAIIRPGPVVGNSVNPYIAARERLRADPDAEIHFDHPSLQEVLKDTHGAIIFQDQVIEVAMAFAGFSAGEADGLRRAMTRKRSAEALEAFRTRFVDKAMALGHATPVDPELATHIFDKLTGFSKYGFPRAHSAAFAILAYQSAWLRYHYPAHWYAALLNAQPMGFYPPNALLGDAQRHGVSARPVDVNRSQALCSVEERDVRLGIACVQGIRYEDALRVQQQRAAQGSFADLADFARRTSLRREQIEQLIAAGATEGLGSDRRRHLWQIGTIAREQQGQEPLALAPSTPPQLSQLSLWDEVVADFAATGMSTRVHPMALLRDVLSAAVLPTNRIREAGDGAVVETAGLVIAVQRPATAKGVVFALLEDEHGTVNVVFRPELGKQLRARLKAERVLRISGRVQLRQGILSIAAQSADVLPNNLRHDLARVPAGKQFS